MPGLTFAGGAKLDKEQLKAQAFRAQELFCTDATGSRRELGEIICISASCQTWMAKCDVSLNNPMWRKIQDGCPTAGISGSTGVLGRLKRLAPEMDAAASAYNPLIFNG